MRIGLEPLLVLLCDVAPRALAAVQIAGTEFGRVSGEINVRFLLRGTATECEDSEKCHADSFHVVGKCWLWGGAARLLRKADKKTPDKGGNRALNTQKRVGNLVLVVYRWRHPAFVREALAHFIIAYPGGVAVIPRASLQGRHPKGVTPRAPRTRRSILPVRRC